jgi:hypothetical protein
MDANGQNMVQEEKLYGHSLEERLGSGPFTYDVKETPAELLRDSAKSGMVWRRRPKGNRVQVGNKRSVVASMGSHMAIRFWLPYSDV